MVPKKQLIIYVTSFIFLTVSIIILVNYKKFKKKGKKHFTFLDLIGFSITNYPWTTGDWDKPCPPCGPENVLQTRTVTCSSPNPDDCYQIAQSDIDPLGKPIEQQYCNNPKCSWTQPTFDSCPPCNFEPTKVLHSLTEVKCPDGSICDINTKPSDIFTCGIDDNKPLSKCSLTFGKWVGGQDFHYQLNSPPNTHLFGTNNIMISGTPNSSINIVDNNIQLATGMNGNFLLFIIWHTDPTKINNFSLDRTNTNISEVNPVFENKTKTFINNSGTNTSLLYYAYIFSIIDNTVQPIISIGNDNNTITIRDTNYKPELFLIQLNDGPTCPKTSCNIGSLPLMVQFQLVNPSNQFPLGSSNSIIFDSIGITLSSSSLKIPNKVFKDDNSSTYMLLIQWGGNTLTDVVIPTVSFSNITTLNFFRNQTASNVNNTLDIQTNKLFYCVMFKLTDVSIPGLILFSTDGILPKGNSVYGDLLLVQTNYITK